MVGAGPAGSTCALSLARKGIETVLLERGSRPGEKNVAGFILATPVLEHIIPEYREEAPLERWIADQSYFYMTAQDHLQVRMRFQHHYDQHLLYSAYRSSFDAWFANKAREAGAELLTGVLVTDLLKEDGRVVGVKVGDEELLANVVVGADGIHTVVGRKAGLVTDNPSRYLLGVKEVLDLSPEVIEERFQLRKGEGTSWLGAGYPLDDICGAIGLITNNDSVTINAFGWVDALRDRGVDLHERLQMSKEHPFIGQLIDGATIREYQAHLFSDGGLVKFGNLYSDGVLLCGDAGSFFVSYWGVPSGMLSGLMAAETVALARKKGDYSAKTMGKYIAFLEKTSLARSLYQNRRTSDYLAESGRKNLPTYLGHIMEIVGESLADETEYIDPAPKTLAKNLYFRIGEEKVPKGMRPLIRILIKVLAPIVGLWSKHKMRKAMR